MDCIFNDDNDNEEKMVKTVAKKTHNVDENTAVVQRRIAKNFAGRTSYRDEIREREQSTMITKNDQNSFVNFENKIITTITCTFCITNYKKNNV
jgi:hypothetical protein